jgi:ubiquinone/menaquinone biosynthesis methyltransferase
VRLSVATNFDPHLIEELSGYPVFEIFGKLREDAAGGGRAPYQLSPVSRKDFAEHVAAARRAGYGFNYLLNASCLGNREITRRGQREMESLLAWVSHIGVTSVTVASPYLLKLIKARFPDLKVRVSVFCGVDRVRKAQMWEELGADCIVLDSILVNRELASLEKIRKSVSCDLELLVNNNCLSGCALSPMHMNALSHAGQSWHENRGFFIDWCFLKCTELKLRDPVNYIRSEWIRPEDLHVYEAMGYDLFKIAERDIPTPLMVARVKAYAGRRHDGNLLDLIQAYGFSGVKETDRYYRRGPGWFLRFFLRPGLVNPLRMLPLKRLADLRHMTRPIKGEEPVYIDNRSLDGFIERFRKEGCADADCEQCRWCHEFAERAVRVDEGSRIRALRAYERVFQVMHDGSMWRYLPAGKGRKFTLKIRDHIGTPERKRFFNEEHFAEAAPRYDFATRAMSLGRDPVWKKELVASLPEIPAPFCVDLGCGTGDVTFLLAGKYSDGRIVGVDIAEPMLKLARERNRFDHVIFERGDMSAPDIPDGSADIVTGSYALRNAPDVDRAIAEIHRILKPGGVAAFLDFSKPPGRRAQILRKFLLKTWCGFWGLVLHRNPEIHGYIAASLDAYPDRSRLLELFQRRGFELTFMRRFSFGITEIFVIRKKQSRVQSSESRENENIRGSEVQKLRKTSNI